MLKFISSRIVFYLTGIFLISGCAAPNYGVPYDKHSITIKTVPSRVATVGHIDIYKQNIGSLIRGEISRNFSDLGTIPGHIDIELTDASGMCLFNGVTYTRQSSLRSNSADFFIKIPFEIAKGSHLLIAHHDGGHQIECVVKVQKS